MISRKKTRVIKIRDIAIGGNNPVVVQSMTNVPLQNVEETIKQINDLEKLGAGIVRIAVRTLDDAEYIPEIIKGTNIPICADIHFNYKIALKSIDNGIDKIRLNPGNIKNEKHVIEVVNAAKLNNVPIRIGVNGGSIDKNKYKSVTPEALVDSAINHLEILENLHFDNIVVSIKSSDIFQTIEANKLFSQKYDYPVHIGLTEAGFGDFCIVQSSIAIGSLLLSGIGDTIRVSMTGSPLGEISPAFDILKSLSLIDYGIKIISCPTCGRTDPSIDLLKISNEVKERLTETFLDKLKSRHIMLSIAVMGCEVNGPGEASHADFGIAGASNGKFILFSKGEKLGVIDENTIIERLSEQIHNIL